MAGGIPSNSVPEALISRGSRTSSTTFEQQHEKNDELIDHVGEDVPHHRPERRLSKSRRRDTHLDRSDPSGLSVLLSSNSPVGESAERQVGASVTEMKTIPTACMTW